MGTRESAREQPEVCVCGGGGTLVGPLCNIPIACVFALDLAWGSGTAPYDSALLLFSLLLFFQLCYHIASRTLPN